MIYPSLYASYSALKTDGALYSLPDVVSIAVVEERNGSFDLEMRYLYKGMNADQLVCEAIIMAVPHHAQSEEPFRIYEVTVPIDGIITVKAHHLSYDLGGVVLTPFNETGLTNILNEINSQFLALGLDFEIVNNGITVSHQFSISYPQTAASVLGQGEHSLIADFDAEVSYEWDSFNGKEVITLNAARGTTSEAMIAYGYNLLSLDYSVNSDAVYSAIYPYFMYDDNGTTTLVTLPEETVSTGATTSRTRVLPVDLTGEFDHTPTAAELRTAANAYVATIDWNAVISCAVDFVPMQNTTEYEDSTDDQTIHLCDTVTISADIIGVTLSAKVVRTVYNQITDKYTEMTVGTIPANIADTIANLEQNQATIYNGSVI